MLEGFTRLLWVTVTERCLNGCPLCRMCLCVCLCVFAPQLLTLHFSTTFFLSKSLSNVSDEMLRPVLLHILAVPAISSSCCCHIELCCAVPCCAHPLFLVWALAAVHDCEAVRLCRYTVHISVWRKVPLCFVFDMHKTCLACFYIAVMELFSQERSKSRKWELWLPLKLWCNSVWSYLGFLSQPLTLF